MSKQETQVIKGIAILMMLFLHLFNQGQEVAALHHLFWVGDAPLVEVLTRAANPVSFYLFCGGYGLYYVYRRGADKHHYTRVLKLFVHYWLVLLVFVTLGHYIAAPGVYPGSLKTLIYNVTGFYTTWNGECWFLLPYVLLSLSSKRLFAWMGRYRTRYVLAVTFFINLCVGYVISRYGSKYLYTNPYLYLPVLYLNLLFAFTLGAMAMRTGVIDRWRAVYAGLAHKQTGVHTYIHCCPRKKLTIMYNTLYISSFF